MVCLVLKLGCRSISTHLPSDTNHFLSHVQSDRVVPVPYVLSVCLAKVRMDIMTKAKRLTYKLELTKGDTGKSNVSFFFFIFLIIFF